MGVKEGEKFETYPTECASRANAPKRAGEVAPEPEALRRATELQSRRQLLARNLSGRLRRDTPTLDKTLQPLGGGPHLWEGPLGKL